MVPSFLLVVARLLGQLVVAVQRVRTHAQAMELGVVGQGDQGGGGLARGRPVALEDLADRAGVGHLPGQGLLDGDLELLGTVLVEERGQLLGGVPQVRAALRQLAQQGNDIVFTTSFGYMDPTLEVAKQFPDVKFEHCSGFKSAPNMGNYFGAMEEARYLSGIAAGLKTKTNKLGFVAAFPIPEVVRGLNAFTLGARSVNEAACFEIPVTLTSTP